MNKDNITGFRCHDADACAMGQNPCPTPFICGCAAPECAVKEGTHKPAEAVHRIHEPTVNHQLTIEREAFEKWLGIKPCGAAHDFGWAAWQARAALAVTPAVVKQSLTTDAVLPEPDDSEFEQQLPIQPIGVMGGGEARKVLWNCTFMPEAGTSFYTEQQVRALLATGGQAQAEKSGE